MLLQNKNIKSIVYCLLACMIISGYLFVDQALAGGKKDIPIQLKYGNIIELLIAEYSKTVRNKEVSADERNVSGLKAAFLKKKKSVIIFFLNNQKITPNNVSVEKALEPFIEIIEEDYQIQKNKK